jgi:hypothetical protein
MQIYKANFIKDESNHGYQRNETHSIGVRPIEGPKQDVTSAGSGPIEEEQPKGLRINPFSFKGWQVKINNDEN